MKLLANNAVTTEKRALLPKLVPGFFFSVFFYWPPPFPTLQLDHSQAGLYGVTHDFSSPSSPDMRLTGEDCQQACWEGGFSVDRVEP